MFLRFFFMEICAHSCVCAKKAVPSRTPTSPHKEARPPRKYVREMQPILLAFGNRIALTADLVSSRATDASALPTHSRSAWGPPSISQILKIWLCLLIEPLPIRSFVSKLPSSVQIMPQLIDKIYLFSKKSARFLAYVHFL